MRLVAPFFPAFPGSIHVRNVYLVPAVPYPDDIPRMDVLPCDAEAFYTCAAAKIGHCLRVPLADYLSALEKARHGMVYIGRDMLGIYGMSHDISIYRRLFFDIGLIPVYLLHYLCCLFFELAVEFLSFGRSIEFTEGVHDYVLSAAAGSYPAEFVVEEIEFRVGEIEHFLDIVEIRAVVYIIADLNAEISAIRGRAVHISRTAVVHQQIKLLLGRSENRVQIIILGRIYVCKCTRSHRKERGTYTYHQNSRRDSKLYT